ncbi:hypothetical protein Psfp_03215 [Pelotomaculum sp. FP]|uniref:putative ABC exporter domain-containing protein n=1 Tax=Pelotomaculum sp. FP TaxID=261474 RepID=UPI001066DCED|nr:putative ABC exporter domain-containing protein [Pelotomaculum sp. FP]TEB14015.1 hypothetical protein Psfp_03215 [Pelotomaculum sp. FP]
MHDYTILLRYDLLKLKNYILEIRRSPKKLVSYFLFAAWIFLIMFPAIKNSGQRAFAVTGDTAHIILAVYALFTGFIMFSSFFSALRKLSYSFQMGDVNLLFPSPLAPNHILLWSLIKKIPSDMAKTCIPALILTPTMFNMGLNIEGILLVYLSIVSLGLLITPVSFLIFLVSVRYGKERWIRGILLISIVWLLFSWLKYTQGNIFSLNVLLGYQAPGILNFPLSGWILQLARAAFFGAAPAVYTAIFLVALTVLAANCLVYALARDYYEDVLELAERMETIHAAKRSGKTQGIFTQTQSSSAIAGLWTRFLNRKRVTVERRFPGSRAFMFNQVVKYRRTGINEYMGYLAPLSVITGLVTGFIAMHNGQAGDHGLLYAQNGILAYFLFFRSFSGPLSEELALPYLYTLPGTFFRKALAINTLPNLRFGLNMFLLNLSYAMIVFLHTKDTGIFMPAVLMSFLVTSLFFEQSNIIALTHVLLPSSLDRKLFYPLMLFLEILIIGIPALIAGGLAFWFTHSEWFAEIAVLAANTAVGIVLLLLSDKIFPYLEMREFSE